MPLVRLTNELRDEYRQLFDTCEIRPQKRNAVDALAGKIVQNRARYEMVGGPLGIPWYFIGVVHCMEASLNFRCHLHNGDPLTARTVQVPAARPSAGSPPFTWEESATDALTFEGLNKVKDWTVASTLYQLERYNGFGYRTRHPEVLTPYLWSYSNHYTSGKYVADGRFDPAAVSSQCGAAVILRRLSEQGVMQFDAEGEVVEQDSLATSEPLVTYSTTQKSADAERLQRALNAYPGIFLRVDGVPGQRTSDAVMKVTGHYLKGDPRAKASVAAAGRG